MKKGFTLVELISVIILLGVISLIVIPIVTNQLNDTKKLASENQIKTIEEAARIYATKNDLGVDTTEKNLTLLQLVNAGFLAKKDMLDSKTGQELPGCVIYKWRLDINDYSFHYNENC